MSVNLVLIFCSLALCLFASPLAALDPAALVRAWATLGWRDIRVVGTGESRGTNFAAKVRKNITGNSTKKSSSNNQIVREASLRGVSILLEFGNTTGRISSSARDQIVILDNDAASLLQILSSPDVRTDSVMLVAKNGTEDYFPAQDLEGVVIGY